MTTSRTVIALALAVLTSACVAPGASAPSSLVPSTAAPSPTPTPAVAECSPSHPMPSGAIVRLYFPCGAPAELRPVDRSIATTGDEAIAEVVRLFLAGPTSAERITGFGSLLSPGDAEIVEIADGRLVLDFAREVNNVSTSAGSRLVLGGLRMTLLALDGVDEIELRLRNDCAAFFEWIQVGPTCHLLTGDGLVETPTPSPSAAAVPAEASTPVATAPSSRTRG